MTTGKFGWNMRRQAILAGCLTVLGALSPASQANAQRRYGDTIDAGTQVVVRTTESINTRNSDGREFMGVVDQDVINRDGNVAIPRGANAALIVRRVSNDEIAVDLDSVRVDGRTYGIVTEGAEVAEGQRQGIGANSRTGQYVGGGAILGAIIGAIAGGGKGAAIGAGAGAAAGAGAQVLTRGRSVAIPSESLLTFNLQQPLRIEAADNRFSRDGHWYRQGYGVDPSAAYSRGLQDGRADAERGREDSWRPNQWNGDQARRDYTAGYTQGYQESSAANRGPGSQSYGLRSPRSGITIGSDKTISWQAPGPVRIYVQEDNRPPTLFASGQSGTQAATWMSPGHLYVFIMRDDRGNEVAREQVDFRQPYGRPDYNR